MRAFYLIVRVCVCVIQENIRKHQDVKLVSDNRKFRKLACKPNFKAFRIFNEDLVAVNMSKKVVRLTKPTYVGMSILDLSKTFMFAFHYDKIVSRYVADR